MTDIIYVELAGIATILGMIIVYFYVMSRPVKPYKGTEVAPSFEETYKKSKKGKRDNI